MSKKTYIAIDLKSFYASVECVERKLNPMTANLVVADPDRTEKTICLAVSPGLKACGVPGRPRLFEVLQRVNLINGERRKLINTEFSGFSYDSTELEVNKELALDFIIAPPRMALYIDYSTRIYEIYLRHVSETDIHVYSIDEVFMDITSYLTHSGKTAKEFTKMLIDEVLAETGITATAGIGSNLYLCKVAMDITAKHIKEDKDGVRIAELDEEAYKRTLWDHRPLTDFWRVGRGYASTLEKHGMYTMGDVARCSLQGEDLLYSLFGVNAELLIDHAWGYEPCNISDIKGYRPETNSISQGQVLQHAYDCEKTRLVVLEMADMLSLDLVEKGLTTNQIVLVIGYESIDSEEFGNSDYAGEIAVDFYGRKVPKHARGTVNMDEYTSSSRIILEKTAELFDKIYNPKLCSRRINITACNVVDESTAKLRKKVVQLDIFTDYSDDESNSNSGSESLAREKRKQIALIDIKKKYGKNAILKGMNYTEGATAKDRNKQIGGHKA